MKISSLLRISIGATALLAISFSVHAEMSADDMGLSKGSVSDVATPTAAKVGGEKPSVTMPGAPPQAPHAFTGLVPVTLEKNACLGCHTKADAGKPKMANMPTPIPTSHFMNSRDPGASEEMKVRGQRYVCTQCHAEQMNVQPLVANDFK